MLTADVCVMFEHINKHLKVCGSLQWLDRPIYFHSLGPDLSWENWCKWCPLVNNLPHCRVMNFKLFERPFCCFNTFPLKSSMTHWHVYFFFLSRHIFRGPSIDQKGIKQCGYYKRRSFSATALTTPPASCVLLMRTYLCLLQLRAKLLHFEISLISYYITNTFFISYTQTHVSHHFHFVHSSASSFGGYLNHTVPFQIRPTPYHSVETWFSCFFFPHTHQYWQTSSTSADD